MTEFDNAIKEFLVVKPPGDMMRRSLKELFPKEGNYAVGVLSLLMATGMALKIGLSESVITQLKPILNISLQIILCVFGCLFTVYAIILAFLNEEYISFLAKQKSENNTTELYRNITYFESTIFLYFIGLILTIIFMVSSNLLTNHFRLTNIFWLDNALAVIILLTYFFYVLRIVLELKSTIYNTVSLFRISVAYKLIQLENNEFEKKEKNDKDK